MGQKFIAIALVILIGLWLGNYFEKKPARSAPNAKLNEINSTSSNTEIAPPSATAPSPELQKTDVKVIERFFASGKSPATVSDLKRRATALKLPSAPGNPAEVDTGISGVYTGYIFESPEQVSKIKIATDVSNKSAHAGTISMEHSGKFDEFEIQNLNQQNFANDNYSFIFSMADGRVVYLKLFSEVYFEKYKMNLRTLSGWVINSADKRIFRAALIDDMSVIDQKPWPDQQLIETLLPKRTLRP